MKTGPRSGVHQVQSKGPHPHARASTPRPLPRVWPDRPGAERGGARRRPGRADGAGTVPRARTGGLRGAGAASSGSGAQDPARTEKGTAQGREGWGRGEATQASRGATGRASGDGGRTPTRTPAPPRARAAEFLQLCPPRPEGARGRRRRGSARGPAGSRAPQAGRAPCSASGSGAPRLPAAGLCPPPPPPRSSRL